jgi:hypothetical protein
MSEPPVDRDLAALRRRVRRILLTAAGVLAVAFVGTRLRARHLSPSPAPPGAITVAEGAHGPVLRFSIAEALAHRDRTVPPLPAHLGMRTLVLVRSGDLGAIARLHPVTVDSVTFESTLPPLPAGEYHAFAEVVSASGATGVLEESVRIDGGMRRWRPTDPTDAMFAGGGVGTPFRFEDGSTLVWRGAAEHRRVGEDAGLRFVWRDQAGRQQYSASATGNARAVLVRGDGGSYLQLDSMTYDAKSGELHFPYAFPAAGRFRLWVQLPVRGRNRIAAFDVTVGERAR